jgi:exonuclease III
VEGSGWWLTCVYGSQGTDAKISFLQELRTIRQSCHGPWLIGGDFNLICSEDDKNNQNLDRAMMGRFRRWINDMSLKESCCMVVVIPRVMGSPTPLW